MSSVASAPLDPSVAPLGAPADTAPGDLRRDKSGRRTCVGCGEALELDVASATTAAIRVVRSPEGELAVDAKGSAFGRGAHVHTRPGCVEGAAARGLSKSFKANCNVDPSVLAALIAAALDRRIEGLISSATRSRAVAFGADAATGAFERGEASLVMVAVDAAAAAQLGVVHAATLAGRAVAWGTKERLGLLFSGGKKPLGIGVVAITSRDLGGALGDAVRARDAVLGASSTRNPSRRSRRNGDNETYPRDGEGEPAREAVSPGSTNHAERGA